MNLVLHNKATGEIYAGNTFADPKYRGMYRITTSDMYEPTKAFYEAKLANGTITPDEYDALTHLKEGVYDPTTGAVVKTSNAELEQLRGANGKVNVSKVQEYIHIQQNNQFIKECINNTTSTTIASAISSCVISSASNFYKYFKNEQDGKTTIKKIGVDVAKGAGHGLLASSIGNGFKYIGFKTDNMFFRDNVNSLVMANGVINICKSVYYFSLGRLSFNELLTNISVSSFLTLANLGLNFILPGAPLIKLASSIVLNMVCSSFLKIPSQNNSCLDSKLHKNICNEFSELANDFNNELMDSYSINYKTINRIHEFVIKNQCLENDEEARKLFIELGIEDKFLTFEDAKEKMKKGEKIKFII
jgi:hypothetical protein